jgi:hypothetical protein
MDADVCGRVIVRYAEIGGGLDYWMRREGREKVQ